MEIYCFLFLVTTSLFCIWSLIKSDAYLFCFFVRNVLLFQNSHALFQVLHNICWRFVRLAKRERHDGSTRGFHCTLPGRPATQHKDRVRKVGPTKDTLLYSNL